MHDDEDELRLDARKRFADLAKATEQPFRRDQTLRVSALELPKHAGHAGRVLGAVEDFSDPEIPLKTRLIAYLRGRPDASYTEMQTMTAAARSPIRRALRDAELEGKLERLVRGIGRQPTVWRVHAGDTQSVPKGTLSPDLGIVDQTVFAPYVAGGTLVAATRARDALHALLILARAIGTTRRRARKGGETARRARRAGATRVLRAAGIDQRIAPALAQQLEFEWCVSRAVLAMAKEAERRISVPWRRWFERAAVKESAAVKRRESRLNDRRRALPLPRLVASGPSVTRGRG